MITENPPKWYNEPTKEMIIDLRSISCISNEDKYMIMNEMANANYPQLIQFNENAIKYKDFDTQRNFTLFDNEIQPSWNQSKMQRSYKAGRIDILDGKKIRDKISNQFKKTYTNYGDLAKRQDIINEKIIANSIANGSINNIQEMINESVENCVQFAESLAKTYKNQSSKKSRKRSQKNLSGNHYLMAERFDKDLSNLKLNKFTKENGCTGFFYQDLKLTFPGFNTIMNIVGGRFYQSGPHLENLNLDSYNHQTVGLKLWFIYDPSSTQDFEKYIATGVPSTFYVQVE